MEHLFTYLKDLGPWAATAAFGLLINMMRKSNKITSSLGETRFKADEAHEEVCSREPEYARRYTTWKAHRKPF
ncbi:MAG TPA: hypothetical protein VGP89_08085 [Candidatus Angelobacter sp.]|jgi:hypothetical protein|nr:hypothetical protein [Candidatus Angelobacter sp.]